MHNYLAIGLGVASAVLVLILIKHGYTEKLFAASALFLRLAISFLVAMTFYKAIAFLFVKRFPTSEYLAVRITFLVLLWGAYVALTELFERFMEPEHVILPKMVDRVGGMLFGGLAGALLVGLSLLTWSFVPYADKVGTMPYKLHGVNMGDLLIDEYAHLSSRMRAPRAFDPQEEKKAYHAMHRAAPPSPAPSAAESPAGAPKAPEAGPSKLPALPPVPR